MNNNQFRRLVLDKDDAAQNGGSSPANSSNTAPSTLGAKKSSFMPMTPRTVKGSDSNADFARQVRERNAALQPTKQYKSAVPKGVKYGKGYTDRAKARAEGEGGADADDKAARIRALEEQMKLGQISTEMFEALRDQITGGDLASTHLVKGLDRKLLERVRRGEDVLGTAGNGAHDNAPPDVDEELERLEEKEIEAVKRDEVKKKGTMAPPPPVAGAKRTRDEIMAELKAQRKAAAEAKAAPVLDSRWKKVGEPGHSRIEIDYKGREMLITVDEDGVVKKKVRKVARPVSEEDQQPLLEMPDESRPVLGFDAVMPEVGKEQEVVEEDSDGDIFEGVGTEYDPLGDEDDDEDSSDEEESNAKKPRKIPLDQTKSSTGSASERQPHTSTEDVPTTKPRNYFKDTPATIEETSEDRTAGIQGLLKKAAKMDAIANGDGSEDEGEGEAHSEEIGEQAVRLKKRAQMLIQQDRDLDDMDMDFGGSRYEDGEDEGEDRIKLSEWKSGKAHDAGEGAEKVNGASGKKNKRKPKKRKGDANNMADIMRVIDGRKTAGK